MSDDIEKVSVQEMEELIQRLPTVMRCAVSVNDWGAVEEIHVLASLERSPKQIVRDVESALLAKWGLRVDHKRISVAQIEPDSDETPPRGRLLISEFGMDSDMIQGTATAFVILQRGEDDAEIIRGQWSGRYLPSRYYTVMAWATIEAINQSRMVNSPFSLVELKTLELAGKSVVMVAISHLDRMGREETLIGSSQVRGDGQGASVRAVLDAVNRRIGS